MRRQNVPVRFFFFLHLTNTNTTIDSCLSVPPMISPVQTELSVIQGFQALLPCVAQGSPEPRVSWEKDGAAVPNRPGKFTVLRSGELIIERAEVSMRNTHMNSLTPFKLRQVCSPLCFPTAVRGRRRVHVRGHQRRGLGQARRPPVHQHETCLQGAAGRRHPEQRPESGPVLPRAGNSASAHLLDLQQQSLPR